ncbi:MAG: glycosyltransferase [Dehalococcoidia bacterium]
MGKRFLFVIPPFHGHLNPAVAVARELIERGHAVAWVTSSSMREVLPEGAAVYDSIGRGYEWSSEKTHELTELPRADQFYAYYRELVLPAAVAGLDDVTRACDEFRPHALFVDQHALAGAIVARRRDLPWATSAPSQQLMNPLRHLIQPWIDERVAELGDACGVAALREVSPALVVAYTSALLVPEDSAAPQVRFVGPAIDPRRFVENDVLSELRPGPKVLVSLSTIYGNEGDAFLLKLGDALHRGGMQGIFSSSSPELARLPAPAVVRPWLPLLTLMPHVDAVVSHGGANTAHEALYFGKPLVFAPLAFDNFMVAQAAVGAGAAIRLRIRRATERDIERVMGEIVGNASYREAAERIGVSLRAGGGGAAAADALLELVA